MAKKQKEELAAEASEEVEEEEAEEGSGSCMPKLCSSKDVRRPSYDHWTDYLVAIDMFGATPQLEIRGKKKVKSCCGASVSFIAGLLIVLYFGFKVLYFMQDIGPVKMFLDIMTNVSGIELQEEVDFKIDFDMNQDSYVYGDWTLV